MQVSKISKQSFGRFIDYNVWDNVQLSPKDVEILEKTIDYIDRTEGRRIDIWGRIGTPNGPDKFYVKLKTVPRKEDLAIIQMSNPDAKNEDYKRHSLWFPLDKTLLYNSLEYLHSQNGYIHYCINHPEHSCKPKEGYKKPIFNKSC